jgi:hypothetical protein
MSMPISVFFFTDVSVADDDDDDDDDVASRRFHHQYLVPFAIILYLLVAFIGGMEFNILLLCDLVAVVVTIIGQNKVPKRYFLLLLLLLLLLFLLFLFLRPRPNMSQVGWI